MRNKGRGGMEGLDVFLSLKLFTDMIKKPLVISTSTKVLSAPPPPPPPTLILDPYRYASIELYE